MAAIGGNENVKLNILDTGQTSHGHIVHIFSDIIVIAFLATICGRKSFDNMEIWSILHEKQLKKYLTLLNGLPDDDTIKRCLEHINIEILANTLYTFLEKFSPTGQPIYLDKAKVLWSQSSFENYHVPVTFLGDSEIIIGKQTDGTDEDLSIDYNVLELFDIADTTVTVDASFASADMVPIILERGANYAVYFNRNHKHALNETSFMYNLIESFFVNSENQKLITQTAVSPRKKEDRVEKRTYALTTNVEIIPEHTKWKNIKALGMVRNEITQCGQEFTETGFYLLSFNNLNRFIKSTRDHMSNEENMYYALDVVYKDKNYGNGPSSLALKLDFIKKLCAMLQRKTIQNSHARLMLTPNSLCELANSDFSVVESVLRGDGIKSR